MIELVQWDDPILRQVCEPVDTANGISSEIRQTINEMIECCRSHHGAGLAAPQIGKSLRIFVCANILSDPVNDDYFVAVNPMIQMWDVDTVMQYEGCLSFPNLSVLVWRPFACMFDYFNIASLSTKTECATGIMSRIVQHEIDHLDGKLLIDDPDARAKWDAILENKQ